MSTNNQLIIIKNKEGFFEIHENLCVDNEFEPSKKTVIKCRERLVDAIKYANEYCNEWPGVEYGYYIDDSCLEKEEGYLKVKKGIKKLKKVRKKI